MRQLKSHAHSVLADLEQQRQLPIPSTMIHGQLLQLHQPVVDGEHLQPTNHLFNRKLTTIPS
jgi:hypothetical protein